VAEGCRVTGRREVGGGRGEAGLCATRWAAAAPACLVLQACRHAYCRQLVPPERQRCTAVLTSTRDRRAPAVAGLLRRRREAGGGRGSVRVGLKSVASKGGSGRAVAPPQAPAPPLPLPAGERPAAHRAAGLSPPACCAVGLPNCSPSKRQAELCSAVWSPRRIPARGRSEEPAACCARVRGARGSPHPTYQPTTRCSSSSTNHSSSRLLTVLVTDGWTAAAGCPASSSREVRRMGCA